jgi:hypothetical protein
LRLHEADVVVARQRVAVVGIGERVSGTKYPDVGVVDVGRAAIGIAPAHAHQEAGDAGGRGLATDEGMAGVDDDARRLSTSGSLSLTTP